MWNFSYSLPNKRFSPLTFGNSTGIYIKKRVANTDGTESFLWEQINNPGAPYTLTWDMAEDYLNYDLIGLD